MVAKDRCGRRSSRSSKDPFKGVTPIYITRVAAVVCALLGTAITPVASMAQPVINAATGPPLELATAAVVGGRTLEIRRFVVRMVTRTTNDNLAAGVKIDVKEGDIRTASTIVVPIIETQIIRIDATKVGARRIDGRAVPFNVLINELQELTPVIFAQHSLQVDPIFSKLLKADSLVLHLKPSFTTTNNRSEHDARRP